MNSQIKKPLAKGLITTADSLNSKAKLKEVIVQIACYGLIPLSLADWLISVGGLCDE